MFILGWGWGQHDLTHAQYFGKNKIQYTQFDWKVMETPHFDIFYYETESELAEMAAAIAESANKKLSAIFRHHLTRRIPLIIYSTHNDFQQTNTSPYFIPESTGGFTEFAKGRVVLPYNGSYFDLKHVLTHELVHVYQLNILHDLQKTHPRLKMTYPPLWFIEGMAEVFSEDWDTEADMILRDLVLSQNLLPIPEIWRISGSYLMYKQGQSILTYIAQHYGEDKIVQMLRDWWKVKDFEEAVPLALGISLVELSRQWMYALQKTYYPVLESRDTPDQTYTRLAFEGFLNYRPAVVPDTTQLRFCFGSNRDGFPGIYYLEGSEPLSKPKRLIKSGQSARFESLHLQRSSIDVNAAEQLVFVSKSGERDALYIYDIPNREIRWRAEFDSLIALSSPAWSPDASRIVFSALNNGGMSDLYMVTVSDQHLTQLTHDVYHDRHPRWSPDGRWIAFSSDRNPWGDQGAYNIYRYDVEQGDIQPLTAGNHIDNYPDWHPNGDYLVYNSDRDGIFDLYLVDLAGNTIPVTRTTTGFSDPRWTADGRSLVASALVNHRPALFWIETPDSLFQQLGFRRDIGDTMTVTMPDSYAVWQPQRTQGEYVERDYKPRFTMDISSSTIAFDSDLRFGGGSVLVFTDMLGNHQLGLVLSNNSGEMGTFFKNFDAWVGYTNLANRMNYTIGGFHFYDEYQEPRNFEDVGSYAERQYGGMVALTYPFSPFRRASLTTLLRRTEQDYYIINDHKNAFLTSLFLNYTKDTSLMFYGTAGPVDGSRYSFSVGHTIDFDDVQLGYTTFVADARRYFRLGTRSCFATRTLGLFSTGDNPEYYRIGGSWTLRGYDWRSLEGTKIILLNNEVRFPVLNRLLLGFPMGTLELPGTEGAIFFDMAYLGEEKFQAPLGSFGLSFRLNLGIVLRLDVAKKTDFDRISRETVTQFFFGYDY